MVFNIGDSRVYRVVEGELVQVTTDHSEVQELVDAGLITSLEAAIHPARNIITRSLGLERDPQPDTWVIEAREQETFVICSDGLTNEVRDDQIARIVSTAADPQTAADRLCEQAEEHGGRDNITVLVVRVG